MRARTLQRLALVEAALVIPDLVIAIRGELKRADTPERTAIKEVIAERVKVLAPAKKLNVGRNAPCPCGSGLKFKRCCIRKG